MSMQLTAIAGVLFVGATTASAQTSDTTFSVYGVGHVSADKAENVADTDYRLASNSSRVGLKGSVQLTEGVKIFAQYEQGIDLTGVGSNDGNGPGDTSGVFTRARDSFVGIRTPYGTVKYGRQGLLNQWVYDVNLFADQVGDLGNIWGGTGFAGRGDNTFSYESPSFGGLTAQAFYTASPSDTVDDSVRVLKINYLRGGLTLGASLAEAEPSGAGLENHSIGTLTATYQIDHETTGGIDLTGSMIGVGYQSERDIGGVSGNDRDGFTLAGAIKMNGRHRLKAQYVASAADQDSADAAQFAVGYDFTITESITLYAAYAEVRNDDLAGFTANNYGHGKAQPPVVLGEDPSVLSIGAIYSFDCKCFGRSQ